MIYSGKIKALRERLGITQVELSKAINLNNKTYSHYENEDLIMPLKYLIKVCDYFNVSVDYILNFTTVKCYSEYRKCMDKKEIGKRLKEFRKENKLTQVLLAEELNTVHPVITNYENGKNLIATPFLYMICKKYNISADYLLGRIDGPKYLKEEN